MIFFFIGYLKNKKTDDLIIYISIGNKLLSLSYVICIPEDKNAVTN